MKEKENRVSALAKEVLQLSRNQLMVQLRFLDAALSRVKLTELPELVYATDGRILAYDPMYVLKGYRSDRAIPVRNYLHFILHCVYRHMFVHTLVDHTAWDLACDIAVEYTITGLGITAAAAAQEVKQEAVYHTLEKEAGQITAEKLYRYYLNKRMKPEEMAELRGLFYADNHQIWYMGEEERAALGLGGWNVVSESTQGEASADNAVFCSEEDWRTISERIQMDMDTFSKRQGRNPSAMLQNLREVNREKYNYSDFLRRFAVRGEVMKVNDDEFDYIFYTYGLKLYGNIPLIEPLEYKEVKRIREFVIAIDTSGSVAGETVQRFVQKTWNILKSTESFFTKINLHIIQCDAAIQEDVKITSQRDFDEYMKAMKIHGLGGTDFRPVFGYVDRLRERKEFTNLKGLIYFTDGFGSFPEKMPVYETAFVFLDEEYNNYNVPPWAIKLVLRREAI